MIDFCIQTGRLYESYPYHNVVFVGMDADGKPRYANQRGIGSDFIGDANGSDKHYSFGIPAAAASDTLCSVRWRRRWAFLPQYWTFPVSRAVRR